MNSKQVISNTSPIIDSSSDYKEELLIDTLYPEDASEYKYEFLTKELATDLIRMYNQKNYTCDGFQDENQMWWYDLLNKFNKTILKPFTNNNSALNEIILPSYMEGLNKILYYADELKKESDKKQKGDSGEGAGKPGKLDLKGLTKKGKEEANNNANGQGSLSGQDLEKFIDKTIKESEEKVQQEMNKLPEETLNNGSSSGDNSDIQVTKSGMDKIQELHRTLRFNKEAINKIIKKTIHKFTNSFKGKSSKEMVDFFDAEELDDLQDLYNLALHPYFFRDIYAEEESFGITVDISVDVSASMNMNVNIGNRKTAYLPDICKYLVYSMAKNKILRDVSVFDYSVSERTLDEFLTKDFRGGGTSINNAIKHVIKKGDNPTIILTDGCDGVDHYSSNIYLLYVSEDSFNNLKNNNSTAVKQYISNKQILGYFNGQFKEL